MDPLGTPEQVAEKLGVTEKTLNYWRYKGTGPRYLRVGKHVRYRWRDVEEWLRQQQAVPA